VNTIKKILISSVCALACTATRADIVYDINALPTIFNSAVEVFYQGGTQTSTPLFNIPFTTSAELHKTVAYAGAVGSLDMSATVSAETIEGQGSVGATASLVSDQNFESDGFATFDIDFLLTATSQVTLSATASTSSSLASPNNLSVVFLVDANNNLLSRAESESGSGTQNASYSGVLSPGWYWLRGLAYYEDNPVTLASNGSPTYSDGGSYAFSLSATPVPLPGSALLFGSGLLGGFFAFRRSRRTAFLDGAALGASS
jgi:hypothetical protein